MKMKGGRYLRAIVLSDIHLGHRRTPTSHILKSLRTLIPLDESLLDIDVIKIVGDITDRALDWSASEVIEIEDWFLELCVAAKRYDVTIDILEGTPSHDDGQAARLVHINKISGVNAKVNYFNKPCVHYDEDYGYWSLYVPDEYHATCDETFEVVKELMAEAMIDQVDFGFFHGFFEHQVPAHTNHHKSVNYRPLVRFVIFCGHNHLQSVLDDFVYVQGSTDRLYFGEEGDKGMYRCVFNLDTPMDNYKITFVKNENALLFNRINISGMDTEEATKTIDDHLADKPDGSWFMIMSDCWNDHISLYHAMRKKHKNFNFDRGRQEDPKVKALEVEYVHKDVVPINENTLSTMIVSRLTEEGMDAVTIASVIKKLEERIVEVSR